MKDFTYLQKKYLADTYINRNLCLVRGDGVCLYDDRNNTYLDMMSNYGVNIFGYNHPVITQAITQQAAKLTCLHSSFTNDMRATASEVLVKECGDAFSKVYWSSSGAEAVEAALKFAILATGKHTCVAFTNAYHGKTLGALAVTAGAKYRQPFKESLGNNYFLTYNDPSSLESLQPEDLAGVIVEPLQGEGGITPATAEFLQKIRAFCDTNNIMLIFDEIQTGLGRTGTFLCSHATKVVPDIVCLGKGLAGGLPVGATVISEKVASHITKGIHTSTFGGNPLACAAALATLELLTSAQMEHITHIGKYFQEQLRAIKSPRITEVRGVGLMIGLEVTGDRNQIIKKMQEQHVLVIPAGDQVVRFLPPYIIQKEHVDQTITVLKSALKE